MEQERKFLRTVDRMVISGGSSGIGKAFIELAINYEPDLKICNLSRSKSEIFLRAPNLTHIGCDLSDPLALGKGVEEVTSWLEKTGPGRILLINNSGFGMFGAFGDLDRDAQLNMMDLNMRAVVDFTHRLLPQLQANGGQVLTVASIAGRQPTPYLSVYGATKAFVLQWSLALAAEFRGTGLQFTALCPGPTESRFFQRAGFDDAPVPGLGHSAEFVVRRAYRALARGRSLVTTGAMNALTGALASRLPLRWQAPIAAAVLRRIRLRGKGGSA